MSSNQSSRFSSSRQPSGTQWLLSLKWLIIICLRVGRKTIGIRVGVGAELQVGVVTVTVTITEVVPLIPTPRILPQCSDDNPIVTPRLRAIGSPVLMLRRSLVWGAYTRLGAGAIGRVAKSKICRFARISPIVTLCGPWCGSYRDILELMVHRLEWTIEVQAIGVSRGYRLKWACSASGRDRASLLREARRAGGHTPTLPKC